MPLIDRPGFDYMQGPDVRNKDLTGRRQEATSTHVLHLSRRPLSVSETIPI
jgi:hypothetical protein